MSKAPKENREDILVKPFLVCPNITEVSKQTGMSRAAIYKIMEKDSFKERADEGKAGSATKCRLFFAGKPCRVR